MGVHDEISKNLMDMPNAIEETDQLDNLTMPVEVVMNEVELPLPPITLQNANLSFKDDEKPVERIKTELEEKVDALTMLVGQLSIIVSDKETKVKKRGFTEKSIRRKAQSIFYQDFKSKNELMISKMRDAAIQARLLQPNDKLPWMTIKYQSDLFFNMQLDEGTRKMYLDSALTLLKNNSK